MLITFKSRAGGDVLMFGDVAKRMLEVIGKDPQDTRGIVTTEQLPAARDALRAAIADDRSRTSRAPDDDEDEEADKPRGMGAAVSFAQRAAPLVELFDHAIREQQPVIWEA